MKKLAAQHRSISGVYIRNSYALGTWEPGRSDIDLTVIWPDPREREILQFLDSYSKLQQRFPMLGEVEIIDANHFGAWAMHGFTGLHSGQWKKIAGTHRAEYSYRGSEQLDRLRHAVSVYRYVFLRYLWGNAPAHILERAAEKIAKLAGNAPVPKSNADGLLRYCLNELSRSIKTIALPVAEPRLDVTAIVGRLEPPRMAVPFPAAKGVRCVVAPHVSRAQKHVLIEGDFDLQEIKTNYPDGVLWNRNLFDFYLSHVDPIEYFAMLRERAVFFGQDPFSEALPLSDEALRETICQYATHMLTYPYRMDLGRLPDLEFDNILCGWYLRTLRYFEDGTLDYDYRTLRDYFGIRFSHHPSRFALLHSVASELAAHLSVDVSANVSRRFQQTA